MQIHFFYFYLNFILLLSNISKIKLIKPARNLSNRYSEIHLIIQGSGVQNLLSDNGYNEADDPSEVYVEGIKKEGCVKTCNLEGDKNKITLRYENKMKSCYYMFYELTNIIEVDLSDFDASEVSKMNGMFYGCSNLEKITFGNIKTDSLENIAGAFTKCHKLKSIDLSNFDFSKVTSINNLFMDSIKLETINFGNIKTSKVEYMESVFNSCLKLISVDLSKFDTTNVKSMSRMFSNCTSLKYLDLSSFVTSKVTRINYMFNSCKSLIFLNLKSFILSSTVSATDTVKSISSNVKYCVSDTTTKSKLSIASDNNVCSDICFKENIRVDLENNICIEDTCSNNNYKYIYNDECYMSCPDNTYEKNCEENDNCEKYNDKIPCYDNTPEGYYLDSGNKIYKKCFSSCKSCYGEGTASNNNCKECKTNFELYMDNNGISNCYEKCDNYHYFNDLNIFLCVPNCPDQYKNTISATKKCIDDCKKDSTYKYEYNNICYEKCPDGKYTLEGSDDLLCYDQAPDGYYFDPGNEIYSKCYETCKKCNIKGRTTNNNCLECKTNYEFYLDNNNVENCYEKCNNYYYFDESNKFFCTPDKKCPSNYNKLIENKNKCVDDCQKDNTYKYEYNNICYQNEHSEEIIIPDETTDVKNQIKTEQPNDVDLIDENPEEEVIHFINITINNENNDIGTNIIKEILISNDNSIYTGNINININNNNGKNIEIQEKVLDSIKEVLDTGINTDNIKEKIFQLILIKSVIQLQQLRIKKM